MLLFALIKCNKEVTMRTLIKNILLFVGKSTIKIIQQTDYPWDGKINMLFETDKPAEMNLLIRIPG